MKTVIVLALRNTVRNPRRSGLTMIAILLGVGLYIMAQSLVEGIEYTMVGTEIDAEHAHLRVMTAAFHADEDFRPTEHDFPEALEVRALLAGVDGAKVTSRISFSAQVGDGVRRVGVRGLVVAPEEYGTVLKLGTLTPAERPELPHVWLGADLARSFGFEAGSRMTLQAKTREGTRNALTDVIVAGVYRTSHPLMDNFSFLIPERFGRPFLNAPAPFATEILALFEKPDQADPLDATIAQKWPTLVAETWREKTAYITRLNAIRRTMLGIVVSIILLIGAAGVTNTSLMSGFERNQEIGTLLALGFERRQVLFMFLVESVVIAAVGTAIGAAIGGGFSAWGEAVGIPFPEVGDQMGAVPLPPRLFLDLSSAIMVKAVVIGLVVALLAALYPAWQTSRMDPMDALREGA